MPLDVTELESIANDGNVCNALGPNGADWLSYLAYKYRGLRTETHFPIADIELEGISFDRELIQEKLAQAVIPKLGTGNFRVERSDFGETISFCLLEERFGTRFGYKGLRDRELIQLPGRGIDAIGIETEPDGPLRLVLGETKTSSEAANPPQVVETSGDGLKQQHLAHLSDLDSTHAKVMDAARRARDRDTQELMLAAALFLEFQEWDRLSIVVYCCLVRPHEAFDSADFGCFRNDPGQFSPAIVRFDAFCVPADLETTVDAWLALAQQQRDAQ